MIENNALKITGYNLLRRMLHFTSGRFLEIYSNHPVLQFYTANDMLNPAKIDPPDLNDQVEKFE